MFGGQKEREYEDAMEEPQVDQDSDQARDALELVVKKGLAQIQLVIQQAIQATTEAQIEVITSTLRSSTTEEYSTSTTTNPNTEYDSTTVQGQEKDKYNALFVAGAVLGIVGGSVAIVGAIYKIVRR